MHAMRIPRILVEELTTQNLNQIERKRVITLNIKQTHYLNKVLRLKIDSYVIAFNDNLVARCVLNSNHGQLELKVEEISVEDNTSKLNIHLFISIIKRDNMDLVIQKATELGVTQITPITSCRSETKLNAANPEKKLEHWRSIVNSSCEQCQQNYPPKVGGLTKFEQALSSLTEKINNKHCSEEKIELNLILSPYSTTKFNEVISNSIAHTNKQLNCINLFVGPEGGFTEEEISLAEQHQCQAISLGPRILRAETAAIASLAILQHLRGDL